MIAWEYGPPVIAALSVWKASFSPIMPPTAMIEFDPEPVYPGDTVTVEDASVGSADRWALWITEGSNPADWERVVVIEMRKGVAYVGPLRGEDVDLLE